MISDKMAELLSEELDPFGVVLKHGVDTGSINYKYRLQDFTDDQAMYILKKMPDRGKKKACFFLEALRQTTENVDIQAHTCGEPSWQKMLQECQKLQRQFK